jgi:putative FmdB family regulatory protein
MPTYDYLCSNCDHEFEKFQSITAGNLKKCPECGKMTLQRLIGTGSGVIFKGSGFYETDYRSKSYKDGKDKAKPETETKKSDKKETKAADKKTADKPKKESKPAAKKK